MLRELFYVLPARSQLRVEALLARFSQATKNRGLGAISASCSAVGSGFDRLICISNKPVPAAAATEEHGRRAARLQFDKLTMNICCSSVVTPENQTINRPVPASAYRQNCVIFQLFLISVMPCYTRSSTWTTGLAFAGYSGSTVNACTDYAWLLLPARLICRITWFTVATTFEIAAAITYYAVVTFQQNNTLPAFARKFSHS